MEISLGLLFIGGLLAWTKQQVEVLWTKTSISPFVRGKNINPSFVELWKLAIYVMNLIVVLWYGLIGCIVVLNSIMCLGFVGEVNAFGDMSIKRSCLELRYSVSTI